MPIGLTYEKELSRTPDSFRTQLSFSYPNVMFGIFIEGQLVATAAVGYTVSFHVRVIKWLCGEDLLLLSIVGKALGVGL